MENDGAVWPNYFKVSYLEGALNAKITSCLITLNLDRQNYPNFIRVIQQTSSRLQAFNSAFLGENRPNYKVNYGVNNGNHAGSDTMQWEPTGSARAAVTGSQRRAKWVSKEKLDTRRREGRYLRYRKSGHRKIEYPYLPAQSPRYFNSAPRLSPISGNPLAGTVTRYLQKSPAGLYTELGYKKARARLRSSQRMC